ncbi:MAG: recombinase family protein [Sphingomonas pseudosanguinis]|uniref:recombinase family protein n=1 Tax=Sphingomonas pseudosanguinis TaxID=413712 RepID=UPI00391BE40B
MIVGYARVSTTNQNLEVQLDELKAHGCERVFTDKATGTNTARLGLTDMMEFVRDGDTLVVTRLDRFARSLSDLYALLERLTGRGVAFHCLRQSIDTSTSTGKLTLAILGAVAEFENDLRRERQRDGIDKAKARGAYRGRKAKVDAALIGERLASGLRPAEVAASLDVSRQTVYRHMRALPQHAVVTPSGG